MKPVSESFTHLLNYEQGPIFTNTALKPQSIALLLEKMQLALLFNRPDKPRILEGEFPVNTLQPEALASGYQSLFHSAASRWH